MAYDTAFKKMASRLTIQKQAKIAARYEVWNSVLECRDGGVL